MSPLLAWGDFHARSCFARSTIPERKRGTTRSLVVKAFIFENLPRRSNNPCHYLSSNSRFHLKNVKTLLRRLGDYFFVCVVLRVDRYNLEKA